MSNLHLTLACGDYDLTRGLIDGSVQAPGIDLTVLTMPSPERHWRTMRFEEFDVAELSMSDYLVGFCAGRELTAIPVFPHRRFRHGFVFCRADNTLKGPEDLTGKRIGLRTFQTTAGVWMRGILGDDFAVDLKSIDWFTQDEEALPWEPPEWLHIEQVPHGDNIERLLLDGEVDALIYPEILPSVAKGDPRVRRLFANPKQVEQEYFKRTGIFPIMHTVVVRNEILKSAPWVAVSMLRAFQESKELCYRRLDDPRQTALAWVLELLDEQRQLMGRDPWPYSLEANKNALTTLIRYSHAEGLIPRKPTVEELFTPNALSESPHYL